MVAGVTWWSCAWVARWIPGWSFAWITRWSFAWITRWNFTWIVWQSFVWILSCRCNCWVVLIKREQETWSHNFWVIFVVKQKETCCLCCWIQNTWVHLRCHSCWGVSQFCSQISSESLKVEGQGIVASPKINKCCNRWDIKLLETWSCDCRDVIWDRKLHEGRDVIWDWDRESLKIGSVVCFWFQRIREKVCLIAR